MGKAQSKRSVDFTTEGKKTPEDELAAGKVEKIEDAEDQKPQVNGDATPQENEKKEAEESENDKDLTTEKSSGEAGGGGGGDEVKQQNGEQAAAAPVEDAATAAAGGATTPKEEAKDEDAAAGEEAISPLADDSSKKTKKEKGKKKWSFRSISFGKKDKQKPARSDAEAVSPTTNGEAADKPAEGVNEDASEKKEEGAAGDAEPTKATENGEASEKELLNGGGDTTTTTTTPTEEKSVAATTNNDQSINDTAATAAAAATATNNTTASSSTTTSPSTAPVAVVETENKIAAEAAAPILSNGNSDAINEKKQPEVVSMPEEKPQQNGTNGEDHGDEEDTETHAAIDDAAAIKAASKAQIESNSKTNEQVFYPTITLSTDETETIIQEGVSDGDVGKTLASIATIEETLINTPDVGGGGDIVVEKKQTEVNASPPPLPVSPPPSQVMAFALGGDSATIMDEDQKVLAPEISSDLTESNVVSIEENIAPIKSVFEEQEKSESSDIEKVEVAASASFMVDEITAKAVQILDDIKQASEGDQQQKEIETDMSFENVGANETVECENEEIEEDSEEELPPPPPSPPSFAEEFEGQEIDIEKIKAMPPMSVEEVLYQFDSNVNEIEKKVLNCEITSNSSIDESNMDEQSTTALIEEVEDKEKQESIVAVVEEEVKDLTTIVLPEEKVEEETVIKDMISEFAENVSVPYLIETEKVTEQEEEIIEQAQSEKPAGMKQENTVDVSTMLAAEIDKLTLNEQKMQKIDNETTLLAATTQQDSKQNVEHELLEKLDDDDDDIEENVAHESAAHNEVESNKEAALHNAAHPVKEIANPMELKENAAAEMITTEQVVSCE